MGVNHRVSYIAVARQFLDGADVEIRLKEVARFLGISTSAVNRLANMERLPEGGRYTKQVVLVPTSRPSLKF